MPSYLLPCGVYNKGTVKYIWSLMWVFFLFTLFFKGGLHCSMIVLKTPAIRPHIFSTLLLQPYCYAKLSMVLFTEGLLQGEKMKTSSIIIMCYFFSIVLQCPYLPNNINFIFMYLNQIHTQGLPHFLFFFFIIFFPSSCHLLFNFVKLVFLEPHVKQINSGFQNGKKQFMFCLLV